MAKIRHIAIATQNAEETAKFYVEAFGLTQISTIETPIVSGAFLTDGTINVAILDFKNDQVAGAERGKDWSGIHHIGFEVENLEEIAQKLAAAGGAPARTSIRRWGWAWGVAATATPRSGIAARTG